MGRMEYSYLAILVGTPFSPDQLTDVITFLLARGGHPPSELGALSCPEVEAFSPPFESIKVLRTAWRIARIPFAQPSSAAHLVAADAPIAANKLFRSIKQNEQGAERSKSRFDSNTKRFRLPLDIDKLGPIEKIKRLQRSSISALRLDRFIMDNTQMNLLKQFRGGRCPQ